MRSHLLKYVFAAMFFGALMLRADEPPPVLQALVTVHPNEPGAAIPADFLGLSYEKSVLTEPHFRADNAEMVNLCRNLGGGVLRFGGNRLESTYWLHAPSPGAPVSTNGAPQVIGPAAVDNLYAFARQSGWRVIHGLNLAGNDPAMAAAEAAYATRVGGPAVLAFEIGNEPDYYPRHDLRPASYGYPQYRSEAGVEQSAILAQIPHAPLAGPATTKSCPWFPGFVADFKDHLALATYHVYSLSAKSKDPHSTNFATVGNLLSPATQKGSMAMIAKYRQAARTAGIPFRLGECNSVSNGGKDGVSDVFASALWGADFLFDVAEQGVDGINFHSGFKAGGYTPLYFSDHHYRPQPLYYSMLLFHQAARGRVVPVDCRTSVNVSAHAVLGDDGKLRVVVINKDLTQGVTASVASGSSRTKAEMIRLTAPSVTSRDGVLLAGSAVGADGLWTPQPGEPVPGAQGKFSLSLPAASAVLLTIE